MIGYNDDRSQGGCRAHDKEGDRWKSISVVAVFAGFAVRVCVCWREGGGRDMCVCVCV